MGRNAPSIILTILWVIDAGSKTRFWAIKTVGLRARMETHMANAKYNTALVARANQLSKSFTNEGSFGIPLAEVKEVMTNLVAMTELTPGQRSARTRCQARLQACLSSADLCVLIDVPVQNLDIAREEPVESLSSIMAHHKGQLKVVKGLNWSSDKQEYLPVSLEEVAETLGDLLFYMEILPRAKVEGEDCIPRPASTREITGPGPSRAHKNSGTRARFLEIAFEAGKVWGHELLERLIESIQTDVDDRLAEVVTEDEGQNINREVDDVAGFLADQISLQAHDEEFNSCYAAAAQVWGVADAALQRHRRMAMRIAATKLSKEAEGSDLISDDLAQRLLDGESQINSDLAHLLPSKDDLLKEEIIALRKDQNSFFRQQLEERAAILRGMGQRAESMLNPSLLKKTRDIKIVLRKQGIWCKYMVTVTQMNRIAFDADYIRMVERHARKILDWSVMRIHRREDARAEKKADLRPGQTLEHLPSFEEGMFSGSALNAIYNEALNVLVALGSFEVDGWCARSLERDRRGGTYYQYWYFKKEYKSQDLCSFTSRPTRKGMVEYKSGLDWAAQLRLEMYDDEGTRKVSVTNHE